MTDGNCAVCALLTLADTVSSDWLIAASIAAGVAIGESLGGIPGNACPAHRKLIDNRLEDAREAAAAPANDQRSPS